MCLVSIKRLQDRCTILQRTTTSLEQQVNERGQQINEKSKLLAQLEELLRVSEATRGLSKKSCEAVLSYLVAKKENNSNIEVPVLETSEENQFFAQVIQIQDVSIENAVKKIKATMFVVFSLLTAFLVLYQNQRYPKILFLP